MSSSQGASDSAICTFGSVWTGAGFIIQVFIHGDNRSIFICHFYIIYITHLFNTVHSAIHRCT